MSSLFLFPIHYYRNVLITIFCLLTLMFNVANAQFIVVSDGLEIDSLSNAQLRGIFTSRLKTIRGQSVKVFIQNIDSRTHRNFTENFLNMRTYQLDGYWRQVVFSGQGRRPQIVGSDRRMLEEISKRDNAIGYVSEPIEYPGVRYIERQ